ncbi:hypothetical protein ACH5A3_39695 [Streptomyces echinatus]|uniref:hypothetical protein n=1 Tax=Streptomyces echinatus TaxID=67293 RepID=UPI0037B7F85D
MSPGSDITPGPAHVCLPRGEFEWLRASYWSALSGMRDVAANLLGEWGHRPEDHPRVLDAMEIELSGALIETASDVMREHGLHDLRVEPDTVPGPVWRCPDCDTNNDLRTDVQCLTCGRARPVSRVRATLPKEGLRHGS